MTLLPPPSWTEDERLMQLARDQAGQARQQGEVPIGAVLVQDGAVVGSGHNLRETQQNPVAHAELIAIEQASQRLGAWRLTDTTLYVTLEPCFMCAGAIVLARIPRVVYACRDPRAGAFGSLTNLNDFPLNHKVELAEGVLHDECRHDLQSFFRGLRAVKG